MAHHFLYPMGSRFRVHYGKTILTNIRGNGSSNGSPGRINTCSSAGTLWKSIKSDECHHYKVAKHIFLFGFLVRYFRIGRLRTLLHGNRGLSSPSGNITDNANERRNRKIVFVLYRGTEIADWSILWTRLTSGKTGYNKWQPWAPVWTNSTER